MKFFFFWCFGSLKINLVEFFQIFICVWRPDGRGHCSMANFKSYLCWNWYSNNKIPFISYGKTHKKKSLLAGTLWPRLENQNNMSLYIPSQRKQIRIWSSSKPLGSNRFSQAKGNGKMLQKKEWAMSLFVAFTK